MEEDSILCTHRGSKLTDEEISEEAFKNVFSL
jgi:hypothetical protein